MCNGANLAYPKSVFDEVNGFEGIDNKASGDDVLLMYKIQKKHPRSIRFMKTEFGIVYTKAQQNWKGFVQQRKRWASKGFSAMNKETRAVSLLVYFHSFSLILLPILSLLCLRNSAIYLPFMEICLILGLIKCFIDFLLLFLAASFFKKKMLLIYFLPEQILYLFYISVIGLVGTVGKYEWKGRQQN